MADSAQQQVNLIYYFAIYVGTFGAMLMIQGLLVSFARLAAAKRKIGNDTGTGLTSGKNEVSKIYIDVLR